ncbi:MAG: IS200/IS605 family transposase [Deltaproteobacteria bacterium]|jgi:putative transposase|nr:IS200/IS605 family transposase [Deltaproteobacteria bacterium]
MLKNSLNKEEYFTGLRIGRHCIFDLSVHLVFMTKYKRGVLTRAILSDLGQIMAHICQHFQAKLVEFNGEDDHVHMLINYPPKVAVSTLVNSLKSVSSRQLRQRDYPALNRLIRNNPLWSPGYFASSGESLPISSWRQYVEVFRAPVPET